MGKKIAAILFIVIACAVVVYVVASGVFGKLTGALSSLVPHVSTSTILSGATASSGNKAVALPPAWSVNLIYSTNTAYSYNSPDSGNSGASAVPVTIPAGYTAAQISPFFHKIAFGAVYAESSYSYGPTAYGQISLTDTSNGTDSIDVTGWEIKSNRGGEYIPTAINVYDPSGLAAATDIFMKRGQTLNIYSDTSPFNFRLNKCIGYIQSVNHFNPALSLSCPYVNQSDLFGFTGACQQYIDSLGSCAIPDLSNFSIPENDYACRAYLEKLNYGGCFAAHSGDSDFLSNEWRVWTGANVIDPLHDTVLLLDRNGLLVDLRTY